MRKLLYPIVLILFTPLCQAEEDRGEFVFVGEKISIERVRPQYGERPLDRKYRAKYRILKTLKGEYSGSEIEFTVFDHYGTPAFSKHPHALLYLENRDGKFVHSKYQFSPVYKTRDGKWAGAYAYVEYRYRREVPQDIKPETIDFAEPVEIDISNLDDYVIRRWYPEPYYEIKGDKAVAKYGNYADDLFRLKQQGVFKAQGKFQ